MEVHTLIWVNTNLYMCFSSTPKQVVKYWLIAAALSLYRNIPGEISSPWIHILRSIRSLPPWPTSPQDISPKESFRKGLVPGDIS